MKLEPEQWTEQLRAHEEVVDQRTAGHLERRSRAEKHPVYDFLFDYYPVRVSQLRRWHPGVGVQLVDPSLSAPHHRWKHYRTNDSLVGLDVDEFIRARGSALRFVRELLTRTMERPEKFGCFGMHEWAMVYKAENIRHDLPLRLGKSATNDVVEAHQLKCTHFDAFRFFTEPARPLNFTPLSRKTQVHQEQGGCVHATMDLYKWAAKLGPVVAGDTLIDAFDLATDARVLDMEASPYDCRSLGFGVVPVETPEGKAQYVERQRALAKRAGQIRKRLLASIDEVYTSKMDP